MGAGGGGVKAVAVTLVVVLFSVAAAAGEKADVAATGQVHHVVGDDIGWKPTIDLASWLSGRIFRVGDIIWFAYSAAEDEIVELQTLEEFLSCDLSNPLKKYSDGFNKVPLEVEGARFFASAKLENCKNGLKLPVKVQPMVAALPPIAPSSSSYITGIYYTFIGFILCFFLV